MAKTTTIAGGSAAPSSNGHDTQAVDNPKALSVMSVLPPIAPRRLSTTPDQKRGSLESGRGSYRRSETRRPFRRKSRLAVDCGIRALMNLDDAERMLSQVSTLTDFDPEDRKTLPWLEQSSRQGLYGCTDRCIKQLASRNTQSALEALSVIGIAMAPLQLAIEPTCEVALEKVGMAILKAVAFSASVLYAFLSFGESYALRRKPLRSLLQYCYEISFWEAQSRRQQEQVKIFVQDDSLDEFKREAKLDWLVLDYFFIFSVIAEFVHLFEVPVSVPTTAQWVCMIQILKGWRWIVPIRQRNSDFWAQVTYLFISVFLFTHVCACLFALVALFEAKNSWISWADSELLESPRSCQGFYWSMFYFASYTITSIGHGDIVPVSKMERAVNALIMILSQMYVAKAFADLTFLISTRNYWDAQRQHRVTQTSAALVTMGAPLALRKRVLTYQDYVWEVRKERRAEECLKDLSDVLRFELHTVKYHKLVLQAPFLAFMSVTALRHIVRSLEDRYHLPSDFIVRRGDEGSDVYFMREGACGVFVTVEPPRWTDEEMKILCDGEYFGEVSMLTSQKRTAWIMARTFSVCSMLPKRAIDEVVAADPSCMVLLAKSMQKALGLKPGINWEEVARRMAQTFGNLETVLSFINKSVEEVNTEPTIEAGVVTWRRYQHLMNRIRVTVLDQKLLWIDMDQQEAGSVDFKCFIHVAYDGKLDAEVEELEKLGFDSEMDSELESLSWKDSSMASRRSRASLTRESMSSMKSQADSIASLCSRVHALESNLSDCPECSEEEKPDVDTSVPCKSARSTKLLKHFPTQGSIIMRKSIDTSDDDPDQEESYQSKLRSSKST